MARLTGKRPNGRLAFSRSLAKESAIEREDVVAASISQNRPGKAVGLQRGVRPHRGRSSEYGNGLIDYDEHIPRFAFLFACVRIRLC